MLYIQEYCIAAVMGSLVLCGMYFLKRNYATRQNRLFLLMILINLVTSALNILSIHTISFPERYSSFVRLATNLGYLWLYNLLAAVFLLYVDSMTRIPRFQKPVLVLTGAVTALNALLLLSSPWTHWIAWFDENLVYRHGFLHPLQYVTAYAEILGALGLILLSRKKVNLYQLLSVCCFILGVLVSQLFQILNPRYVVSNLVNTLSLFFLFSSFENQAYYLYRNTLCFNRYAFVNTIRDLQKKKQPYRVTLLRLEHLRNTMAQSHRSTADQLNVLLADRLYHTFRDRVYVLGNNGFAVVTEQRNKAFHHNIPEQALRCFEEPFELTVEETAKTVHLSPMILNIHVTEHFPNGYELMNFISLPDSFTRPEIPDEELDSALQPLRRESLMLKLIDDALENRKFRIYYQPILNTATGGYTSAEALIRLFDEKEGMINPEELIRAAERNGRIDAIGVYVFEEVCRMIRDQQISRLGLRYIDINLSPRQARQANLAQTLLALLKKYGVSTDQINLEITETAEISPAEMKELLVFMDQMRAEGITFSLDDFGSGYAAMNTLLQLPVTLVKFDKTILWQAMKDEKPMTVMKNSMYSIREIGKQVLVEGVETAEMESELRKIGCDLMQGYLYARPMPEEDLIRFLRDYTH